MPSVTHNTNLEDGDEIRMEGFAELACGNSPFYATANRLYFKIGSGSAEPAREVFALMKRVEAIHKDSVPVPYVDHRADLGIAAVVAGEEKELELVDDEQRNGPGDAG